MQEILLNVESKEIRYAHLKMGLLHNLIIERKKSRQITGNIYLGYVKNILHNIQSAFIDIGEGDNGFIHITDILENAKIFEETYELDFAKHDKPEKKQQQDISRLLEPGQPVLVQVLKEPIGSKGARLTSNISVAGRYLVLLPNSQHKGVSRKIEDRKVRDRLKKLINAFEMPKDMGIICRTACVHASEEALIDEANELIKNWNQIIENFHKAKGPTCLYQESDLIKRAVITAVDKKFDRILIDDYATHKHCKKIYANYAKEHPLKIELYRDTAPIFERFNVEKEIEKALRRKIWLPCGGYLYFDKTEAMHTIDVNSGRSQEEQQSSKNVEEALVRVNLEAAEEIARQLRLRNVGGLVICDFIDMRFKKSQRRVLDRLKDCMKEDSAKCSILSMSEFGLVEMTRQRQRESLSQTLMTDCPYCYGKGLIKNFETVSVEIERTLKKLIYNQKQYALKLTLHPKIANFLNGEDKKHFIEIAEKGNANLKIEKDDELHLNDFEFYSTTSNEKIEF